MRGEDGNGNNTRSRLRLDFIGPVLRRTWSERELLWTIVAVVLLSTIVFTSIPRLFNAMADDGIAHAVRITNPFERNIVMSQGTRIEPGVDDIYAPIDAEGEEFQENLAPSIQSIIERRTFLVDTVLYRVVLFEGTTAAPFPRYITFRHQSEIDPHISIVSGVAPAVGDDIVVSPRSVTGQQDPQDIPVVEIAISTETARQMSVQIGDRLVLEPHTDDSLSRSIPRREHRFIAAEIVGLLEVDDTDEEFWFGNPQIDRAVEYDDGVTIHIYATALMNPGVYPILYADSPMPFRYSWRYFVNPDALDAGMLGQLSQDVRRLDASYGFSTFTRPDQTNVRTGLSNVFRRYESQRNLTEAILSMTSIGLLAVAVSVIALVGTLAAERNRESITLTRSRGGSTRQILLGQVAEGIVLCIPAMLAGFGIAILLTDGRLSALSYAGALLIGISAIALLAVAVLPLTRRGLGALQRQEMRSNRAGGKRIVLDLGIVMVAVVGVYLFRRRGLTGSSSTTNINDFDPYLAAVPVLLGLATGIVVLRFYPLPIRLLAWLSSLRRDAVLVLGFRRVARHRSASNLPLLVLLLAVAVSVFSSILLHSISVGQVESSWQLVGADYRVQAAGNGYLFRTIDVSNVEGVEQTAEVHVASEVVVAGQAGTLATVQFMAPDIDAMSRVTQGTLAEANFPARMSAELSSAEIGQAGNPIPAVTSPFIGGRAMAPGDFFELNVIGRQVTFEVVDVRERFPGLSTDRSFVVASREQVQMVNPNRTMRAAWLLIKAPPESAAALTTTIEGQSMSARVLSRTEEFNRVHESPLIAGVQSGYRIGLIVTGIYAALAVVIATTLSSHERTREYGMLRTMGLSRDQTTGLTVIEFAPPFAMAVAAGLGLGIGVARLVEPAVDLTAFTGPGIPVSLQVNWLALGMLILGLAVVVTAAIAAATSIAGRASLSRVLRVGD